LLLLLLVPVVSCSRTTLQAVVQAAAFGACWGSTIHIFSVLFIVRHIGTVQHQHQQALPAAAAAAAVGQLDRAYLWCVCGNRRKQQQSA
jgi:hypothetical protein